MPISGPTYDFNWSSVNNAPDKHGVYILYQAGKVTYIGRATDPGVTLRSRLQAHKRGDLGKSTKEAAAFQSEATDNPVTAAARERQLLWDYQYLNGRPAWDYDPFLKFR